MNALTLTTDSGVAELTLIGPGKGNAFGPDFWREMPELFRALDEDHDVRVVVLRGAGEHFSYGLDLAAAMAELGPLLMGPQMAGSRTKLHDLILRYQRAIDAVEQCRKPVIAAVHGWCVGAGLDLAAACDFRLCAANAQFSLREVRVAMVADVGSLQRLPAIIGEGATRELAFTGKDIDAATALRIGLINRVLPDPGALFDDARATALQIAANPALAVQGIKRVMNFSSEHGSVAGRHHVAAWNAAFLQSEDLAEAFAAFAQKREPIFQGK